MASLASNPISVSSAADRSYKPTHSYHNNQWHQERFGPDPTKMQVPTTPGGDHLVHDRGESEADMGGEQEYMGGGGGSRSASSRFRSTARQVMAAHRFGDGGGAGSGARATEATATAIVAGAARGSAALADEVGGDASLSLGVGVGVGVAPLKLEKPDETGEIDGFLSDLVQPALTDRRCDHP